MKTAILITGILLSNLGLAKEMECQVVKTDLVSQSDSALSYTFQEGVKGQIPELFGYQVSATLNFGQILILAENGQQKISANSGDRSAVNLRFENPLEIAEVTCTVK